MFCANCKNRKKIATIKVGIECAPNTLFNMCKREAFIVSVTDNVTGKKFVPKNKIESILCLTLNADGACTHYDQKAGVQEVEEAELEIVGGETH